MGKDGYFSWKYNYGARIQSKLTRPANIHLFKVNSRTLEKLWNIFKVNKNSRTPEQHNWLRFGVFIVNFGHISNIFLMFL